MCKFTKEAIGRRFIIKDRITGINVSQVDVLDVGEKTYHLKYQHAQNSNWYEKSRFDNDFVVVECLSDSKKSTPPTVKLDNSLKYVKCIEDIEECHSGRIYLRDENYIILPSGNLLRVSAHILEHFRESSLEEYQELHNRWKVGELAWMTPGKKFLALIDKVSGWKADVTIVQNPADKKLEDLWWEGFERPTEQEVINHLRSIFHQPLGQKLTCISTGCMFHYDPSRLSYAHGVLWQDHPEGDNWVLWKDGRFAAEHSTPPEPKLSPVPGMWCKYPSIETLYGIITGLSPRGAAADVDHLNGEKNVLKVDQLTSPTETEIKNYLCLLAAERYPIGSLVKSLLVENTYNFKIKDHHFVYDEDTDTLYVDMAHGSYAIYSKGRWAELATPFKIGEYIWSGSHMSSLGKVLGFDGLDWVIVSAWHNPSQVMTWNAKYCIRPTQQQLQGRVVLKQDKTEPTRWKPTRWKPKYGDTYWYFDGLLEVKNADFVMLGIDTIRYQSGNCFQDEWEAKEVVGQIKTMLESRW